MLLRTKTFAVAIWCILAVFTGGAVADSGYLADVDDLPLPPGLSEDDSARVVFDKPEGRIVEAQATGSGTPAGVEDFYAGALPALGWQARGNGAWSRGDEVLQLTISQDGPQVVVRYLITPAAR